MERKKIKIAYFISSFSHGRGGHYYSLRTTAEALNGQVDTLILCAGSTSSPVLDVSGFKVYNFISHTCCIFGIYLRMLRVLKQEKPEVLHAFDFTSLFFVRLLSRKLRLPYLMTKTAGANPVKFWPWAPDMILYSEENRRWFAAHPKFKDTRFHLLPARAIPAVPDAVRIEKIRTMLNLNNSICLMRISRIGSRYLEGCMQSIQLVKRLNKAGLPAKLLLIGVVENTETLAQIKKQANDRVIILNDDAFTLNASSLLDIADIVIGNGRSIMEAAALSKIIMTPHPGMQLPLLISNGNFQPLFDHNFELRKPIEAFDEQHAFAELTSILKNTTLRHKQQQESAVMFEENFDLRKKTVKLINIYSELKYENKFDFPDLLRHFMIVLKIFIKRKTAAH